MRTGRLLVVLLLLVGVPSLGSAATINFDTLSDGENVIGQYFGLAFSNTTVLTAGVSLNEVDFPPHSGTNVAFDDGGPIWISFTAPIAHFCGYFTYNTRLTLSAYDAGNVLLGTVESAVESNLGSSVGPGGAPNELLALAFSNIASVTITGDGGGASFTLDDLEYTPAGDVPIPEPGTLSLLTIGAAGLSLKRQMRRRD